MPKHKAQYAEQEPAQNVREPMHAKVHAQKPPCERQKNHDPAILGNTKENGTRNRQVVHRVTRREAVLVERRNFRLDLRVRRERARAFGIEFNHLVKHKAHRERHERLPEDRQKAVPADLQEDEQRERRPDVAVAKAHVKFEEFLGSLGKTAICPVDRHPIVKFCYAF